MTETARDEQRWRVLLRRALTRGGVTVNLAVPTSATSVTCGFAHHEPDTKYAAFVTPSWGTTASVTSKSTTSCALAFGTAAPANATVDVVILRSETP